MKYSEDKYKGDRHGLFTILEYLGRVNGIYTVSALCDCGTIKKVALGHLRTGHTKSCGCWQSEIRGKSSRTHGLSKHPIYGIYNKILERCYHEDCPAYPHYGGRGIKVCDEWRNDFKIFYDWMILNNWESGKEVDRYPNNNGDYDPSNCRLATRKQQCRNKRNNVLVDYNGEQMCVSEFAEKHGLGYMYVYKRAKKGKTGAELIMERERVTITFKGETRTISDWSKKTEIPYHVLYDRLIVYKVPLERIFEPVRSGDYRKAVIEQD